ncbi:hypothetical protein EVG20_g7686 [Dentipellis fragilis]|uniref:Uncharacterized protein n=1 Tax=Dentipellis fragilis TaxID=205917 RepID=A0A4Y9YAW6_9AGAM|nr:hypothetical protein EVG20_g7686 [Dentipellis fragilis]
MSTKTQTAHSYFPRFGFKSAPKPAPRPTAQDDDDWYTPYNGPFEIPDTLAQQQLHDRARDSWGQVLNSAMQHEAVLPDPELAQRYQNGEASAGGSGDGVGDGQGGHKGRTHRGRAVTLSSAIASRGPDRRGSSPRQRSPPATIVNRHPQAYISSYIDLDAAGGIGDSPMPIQRNHHSQSAPPNPPPSASNRLSLASFLTFGNSARKRTNSVAERSPIDEPGASQPNSRPSTPTSGSLRRRRSKRTRAAQEQSQGTTEDDYYNSYYSTLLTTPKTADPPAAARLPRQHHHLNHASARRDPSLLHCATPIRVPLPLRPLPALAHWPTPPRAPRLHPP